MDAVDELAAAVGVAQACRVLGVPRSSHYRARQVSEAPPPAPRARPAPARALSAEECTIVREVLNSPRFQDCAVRQVYATLLDEAVYLCSWRTMYRILAAADEVPERRDQLHHPTYTKPELLATQPRELWSWDITKLKGPSKSTYYYLYVILDVFSRYVVGFLISERETAELAEAFIAETCAKEGIGPDQLTLHADRGSAMTSKRVAQLLADLGVTGCPLGVPFAAARLERQSVFGKSGGDAEIPPRLPGPVRQPGRWPRVGTRVLSLVQPYAPSQWDRIAHAGNRSYWSGDGGDHSTTRGLGGGVSGPSGALRARLSQTASTSNRCLDQPTNRCGARSRAAFRAARSNAIKRGWFEPADLP